MHFVVVFSLDFASEFGSRQHWRHVGLVDEQGSEILTMKRLFPLRNCVGMLLWMPVADACPIFCFAGEVEDTQMKRISAYKYVILCRQGQNERHQ